MFSGGILTINREAGETKIDIRCKDSNTKVNFKKVAAEFDSYEDVIKWVNANYEIFKKIVPPRPVKGGVL